MPGLCPGGKANGTQGAIVNISSGAGIVGIPNRLGYSASKFAVSGITKSMSLELAQFGIRVNAVAPGIIRTSMTSAVFEDPVKLEEIRALHPIGREGQAEEVAAAIAFLLSDDASFITGVVLPVDGGNRQESRRSRQLADRLIGPVGAHAATPEDGRRNRRGHRQIEPGQQIRGLVVAHTSLAATWKSRDVMTR